MAVADTSRARRLELILQQLESLPTLPSVAMRLLQVTGSDSSDAREVTELVRGDQALMSKVLALCHHAGSGLRRDVVTLDRAVVLLGFDAIRNAVLSIQVFAVFAEDDQSRAPADEDAAATSIQFNRAAFWRHSLAVAIASELIAARHRDQQDLDPAEAFVCGLLHDLGKLALDHILPRSYQRVVELTEQTQGDIAEVERRVIGLDHQTTGKRLAERWGLPTVIRDSVWLHGTQYEAMPPVDNRRMIGLVGLADLLVRRQHIGYSGNYALHHDLAERAEELGLLPEQVEKVAGEVHEELNRRASALGLGHAPSRELFLESIMQANVVLGRLNRQLHARRRTLDAQERALQSIARFHEHVSAPARSLQDVLEAVGQSAASVMGPGFYATICQTAANEPLLVCQCDSEGRLLHSDLVEPPPHAPDLARVLDRQQVSADAVGLLPWIADRLLDYQDLTDVRLMRLPCGDEMAVMLLHDRPDLPTETQLQALTGSWAAAIVAAQRQEAANRMGEQLAEANRQLQLIQQSVLNHRTLTAVGEVAAGAAHEMNNPLAVISGRAQLLAMRLAANPRDRQDVELIGQQAQKLSDLITALRLFADPPTPELTAVAVSDVIEKSIKLAKQRQPEAPAIQLNYVDPLPPIRTDPDQLSAGLAELLINALQAQPRTAVKMRIHVDPLKGRWTFTVTDDGVGMDRHTLQHAMDPFFSAKPAGRQVGLGLARARRLAEVLGGELHLDSASNQGTCATLTVPLAMTPDPTEVIETELEEAAETLPEELSGESRAHQTQVEGAAFAGR